MSKGRNLLIFAENINFVQEYAKMHTEARADGTSVLNILSTKTVLIAEVII